LMESRGRWGFMVSALCLMMVFLPHHGEAQDLSTLISSCSGVSQLQVSRCQGAALTAQAAQGALGLSASGGTDLPGSASTLGWRTKGSPRFAVSVWGSVARVPIPSLDPGKGFRRERHPPPFPPFTSQEPSASSTAFPWPPPWAASGPSTSPPPPNGSTPPGARVSWKTAQGGVLGPGLGF